MAKKIMTESVLMKAMVKAVSENVEYFRNKWGYHADDPSYDKSFEPYSNDLIQDFDSIIKRYGWELSPMTEKVKFFDKTDKGPEKGKEDSDYIYRNKIYTVYFVMPNPDAPRTADWEYVMADMQQMATSKGLIIKYGRRNSIKNKKLDVTQPPLKKEKPMVDKQNPKEGMFYFILMPKDEANKYE